jgi:hypothetical protein
MKTIYLDIKHVGEPGERMPVGGVVMGECPDDVLKVEPRVHIGISKDVVIIVVIDKAIELYPPECSEGDRRKEDHAENGPNIP